MIVPVLFLGEGTSDNGIVPQIEALAARQGIEVAVTAPDFGRLPERRGRTLRDKLQVAVAQGSDYRLIIVHRDADNQGRDARLAEIGAAMRAVLPETGYAPAIPVRMTEAWLLTDENEVRRVAGNPRGTARLDLPSPARVESVADPKAKLKDALALASGLSGRRLKQFKERFPQHRRQLLERLDPDGRIAAVDSWRRFVTDVTTSLKAACAGSP